METAIGCLKHIFFLRGECQDLFSMCWLPHISFNFPVELSLLILCDCDTTFFLFFFFRHYKPLCFFSVHTLPLFCGLPHLFASFSERNCPWVEMSLCECHTNILCVSIIFGWIPHVRLHFFLFKCYKNIYVSPLLLLCFLLGHSWTIFILILCGLLHLIFFFTEKIPIVHPPLVI